MHVARVLTNETCNQNCSFCHARRAREDRAFVAAATVRARIDGAAERGGEVVLTGGEPTLRTDLAALIAYARERGAAKVTLETNGALVGEATARALAAAGLDRARIHLPRFGPLLDEVTRDPGGFDAALAGARAFHAAGVAIEASAPVVRSTAAFVPELPRALAGAALGFDALELGVPVGGPSAAELLPIAEAAAIIAATEANARTVGFVLRLSMDAPIPPCAFDRPARLAHLFSLTPGGREREGFRRLDGCEACVASDRCPGFPIAALEREPDLRARPIEDDRVRRRLSVISTVEAQVERELQQDDLYRRGGASIPARIVRINFHCNQACRFCFVSTHLPRADDGAIERAIEGIARERGVLVISGGEPTLNPRVVEYVELGKRLGASEIELQTNAMRLAENDLAARLRDAGVDQAFISLHGSKAEISDAVTEAPGTFVKTVRGIEAAVRAGIRTRLNFVFCQRNMADFPDYVGFVHGRWPEVTVVVSFVAGSTDVVPLTADLIPRYRDVLPHLAEGLRRARALGLPIEGFESMCGIPLCLVPADLSAYFALAEIPPTFDRGEFVYADACTGCALRGKCFGLRRGYRQLHGSEELRTIAE
jgi:MoaA/NifB/PqqE/SkfB family radical SAM enzyme